MREKKNFDGLIYYPDTTKPKSYFYIAESAMPQTDSNGDPMISLIGAGPQWFFQTSTRWSAPSEKVDLLAKFMMENELIQSPMDLNPAPIQIEKVELVLKTPAEERVLATSGSSGHYPFTAVFNTTLSDEFQKEIVSAFHGKEATLFVRYIALLGVDYPVEMTLTGPIHRVREKLSKENSLNDIIGWVDEQISQGVFKVTSQIDEETPEELIPEVHQKLIDKTVDEVHRYLNQQDTQPESSSLEVKINETFQFPEEFIASTDISTWFKDNSNEYIKIIN